MRKLRASSATTQYMLVTIAAHWRRRLAVARLYED
jgi:hypothetical protein